MAKHLHVGIAISIGLTLGACEAEVNNCEITEYVPSSNVYQLTYEISTPADCPVPLANPGSETKRVAAKVSDWYNPDMGFAYINVANSDGDIQRGRVALFVQVPGSNPSVRYTEAAIDYVAATGTGQFADHDIGQLYGVGLGGSSTIAFAAIKITYQQSSLAINIAGPEVPSSSTMQTWSAVTSGGSPPFTYQWYRDGQAVGSSSSYNASTGTENFVLRVEATDQTWSTRSAVYLVEVDGVRVGMSGPVIAYYSAGGNTWYASGSGGSTPYTFNWYVDGSHVGSGSSWYGYPGEGSHQLLVTIQDANGKTHGRQMEVMGIGDGGEGCQPVPPQLTCDPGEE